MKTSFFCHELLLLLPLIGAVEALSDCSHMTCELEKHTCSRYRLQQLEPEARCFGVWAMCERHDCVKTTAFEHGRWISDEAEEAWSNLQALCPHFAAHLLLQRSQYGVKSDECDGRTFTTIRVNHHKNERYCAGSGGGGGHRCAMGFLSGDTTRCECGQLLPKPDIIYSFKGAGHDGAIVSGGEGPVLYGGKHAGATLVSLSLKLAGHLPESRGEAVDVSRRVVSFRYTLSDGTVFGTGDDALGVPQIFAWTIDHTGALVGSAHARVVFLDGGVEGAVDFEGSRATNFIVDSSTCAASKGVVYSATSHAAHAAAVAACGAEVRSVWDRRGGHAGGHGTISITNDECSATRTAPPGSGCASGAMHVPIRVQKTSA